MNPATAPRVPETVSSLARWSSAGVFGPAELHGAAVLVRADALADEPVQLAAALALWAPLHGHACVDLATVGHTVAAACTVDDDDAQSRHDDVGGDDPARSARAHDLVSLPWPPVDAWRAALAESSICRVVSGPDAQAVLDDHPLVLNGSMLYTQRQWLDECVVAADLRRRATIVDVDVDVPAASLAVLEQLLPAILDGAPNRQHDAALLAVRSRLAVIVGGPGTGKTHTIARLLAAIVHRTGAGGAPLRIALAAPTGKAAARMGEALTVAIGGFAGLDPRLAEQLGQLRPTTVHRLLGVRGRRTRFLHDAVHPLLDDVVVVDEASMLALPMMARLVEALRPDATLILVGDPDQLESIEVGSVLADIVGAGSSASSPLHDRVIRLDRPRRQVAGSPIGPLADAIRLADGPGVLARLGSIDASGDTSSGAPIMFVDTDAMRPELVESAIRDVVIPPLQAAAAAASFGRATDALARFADVRVLCAHRRGPYGVERWNRLIEAWLLADTPAARPPRYYPGRPLLVTRNDQRQRIANGDTGIIVAADTGLRAAFATADGLRLLAPAQLDTVETAYAMTIHKSQGSEYATVVVVLPPAGSLLNARELLYTAVTRATTRLVVVGTRAAVLDAVNSPGHRITGLEAALR